MAMSEQPYYNAFNSSTTTPVVVQGVLVSNPNRTTAHVYDHNHVNAGVGAMEVQRATYPTDEAVRTGGEWTKGEVQPRKCNDVFFAVLFYAHLGVMAWTAGTYAPRMFEEVAASAADMSNGGRSLEDYLGSDGNDNVKNNNAASGVSSNLLSRMVNSAHGLLSAIPMSTNERSLEENEVSGTNDFDDMVLLLGISAIVAFAISTIALSFMIRHAESLIKFALLFNIGATAVFAIGALFLSPFAAIMGIFLTALTVYYAYIVWGRIPFAACNLVAATTAVRSNLGLAALAYSSLVVMLGWSIWWMISFVSTVYITSGCNGQGECQNETSGWLVFALLLSYYWTTQVITNTVHVTVAGTVGTWWFVPTEATSCCSHGVRDSFLRSITNSFGSICLGSLLVAIVEASKNMVRHLRDSEDGGIFLCLAECILACLQDIIEYFNKWAFVFVGLYGYTFLEAGKNVMELFRTRGWTTIITDNLAQGVLAMVSAGVGLITGLVSLAIATGQGMVFGDEIGGRAAAFFIGFIIGTVLTSTLMTIVSSAVNTVIVCYAEAPQEFQINHPKLSEEMRAAWRQAWPVEFHY